MKKTSIGFKFILVLIPLIFFCLFGITNKVDATIMTASQVLMSPYTCPPMSFGTHSVTVIVSTNSNYNPNSTFNTDSDCAAYDASAIYKYNSGITCGNTVFAGSFQWNPLFSTLPPPVSGVCGSSNNTSSFTPPSSNLCSVGYASVVSTNSNTFTWSCYGSSGGSTASCSATRLVAVSGKCGTTSHVCTTGTLGDTSDTSTQYKWSCIGLNGGTNVACNLAKPINAVCSLTTSHVCTTGTLGDTSDTSTQYKWSCVGSSGGTNAICTLNKPVAGVCGSINNICTTGTSVDIADSTTQYLWNCNGSNGGKSASCVINIPINGVCNTITNNICTTGTSVDIADSTTQYLWNCNGSSGGTSASCTINKISSYSCSPSSNTANVGDIVRWNSNGVSGGNPPYNYIWSEASGGSNPATTITTYFDRLYSSTDIGIKNEYLQITDKLGFSTSFQLCSSSITVSSLCTPNYTCNNNIYQDSNNCPSSAQTDCSTSGKICSVSAGGCTSMPEAGTIKDFKASPSTININGSCNLSFSLKGVDSSTYCKLTDLSNPSSPFDIDLTKIMDATQLSTLKTFSNLTKESAYKLICGQKVVIEGITSYVPSGTPKYATCYINPTVKEHN